MIATAGECAPPVVIVSWNTRELLLDCLRSLDSALRNSAATFRVEIWVIDNASSDGSPEAVREHFPKVGLVELDRNVGYARGINQGIAR